MPRGDLFHELKRCGGCFSERCVRALLHRAWCARRRAFVAKADAANAVGRRAVRDVIYPMLCALAYMHSENIIHRDVKPENTLVSDDGVALLADFGLSMDCGLERPATRLGTLDYMAPEVLRCPDKDAHSPPGPQLYDGKVDSWAVGILAFEVLVGRAPFEQDCKQTTCDLICYGSFVMPSFLSANAKDFITRALCKNAAARPCIADLLAHPWVLGEARRNSGAERRPSAGGIGSFLLNRVFKDSKGAAPAQKQRVDAPAGGTSRLAALQCAAGVTLPGKPAVVATVATARRARRCATLRICRLMLTPSA